MYQNQCSWTAPTANQCGEPRATLQCILGYKRTPGLLSPPQPINDGRSVGNEIRVHVSDYTVHTTVTASVTLLQLLRNWFSWRFPSFCREPEHLGHRGVRTAGPSEWVEPSSQALKWAPPSRRCFSCLHGCKQQLCAKAWSTAPKTKHWGWRDYPNSSGFGRGLQHGQLCSAPAELGKTGTKVYIGTDLTNNSSQIWSLSGVKWQVPGSIDGSIKLSHLQTLMCSLRLFANSCFFMPEVCTICVFFGGLLFFFSLLRIID